MSTKCDPLPHDHLFVRLQASPGKGVGVFAIRDVPRGLNPFRGDDGVTVRVPIARVDRIEDPELRRFYLDFCPVVDGCFLAPADFNRMTIAWYMNHSDEPNVAADPAINFITSRPILKGEELTVDYTTFSHHAGSFVATWRTKGHPRR